MLTRRSPPSLLPPPKKKEERHVIAAIFSEMNEERLVKLSGSENY